MKGPFFTELTLSEEASLSGGAKIKTVVIRPIIIAPATGGIGTGGTTTGGMSGGNTINTGVITT